MQQRQRMHAPPTAQRSTPTLGPGRRRLQPQQLATAISNEGDAAVSGHAELGATACRCLLGCLAAAPGRRCFSRCGHWRHGAVAIWRRAVPGSCCRGVCRGWCQWRWGHCDPDHASSSGRQCSCVRIGGLRARPAPGGKGPGTSAPQHPAQGVRQAQQAAACHLQQVAQVKGAQHHHERHRARVDARLGVRRRGELEGGGRRPRSAWLLRPGGCAGCIPDGQLAPVRELRTCSRRWGAVSRGRQPGGFR
jgi:hypothetical protein